MEISIDPRKYVVLDVETNGLKSKEDDLLSISLYKPDDRKIWNRFLPLELEKTVKTTYRNGITKEDLKDATPLTQKEFDEIIKAFELENRTILFYAGETGFDDIFLREYMRRKCIHGFEKLRFYNFKKQIISSKFSGGNVSKDTLCILFNIPNVTKIHTGVNDCRLEWELFQKLNGQYYLITQGQFKGDNVFRLSPDYIIPVSYLESHPNLGRVITNRPYIECDSRIFKTFQISAIGIKKFETNFNGMIIEHLLDVMLHAEKIDSRRFLYENKSKLEYIGEIPSAYDEVPLIFNEDGTVTAPFPKDKAKEKELNAAITLLKERLKPVVSFIKEDIFDGDRIKSQELVVDYEHNILAVCDLSSEKAVLEIKTTNSDSEVYKEQIFYESNGRECYHLKMDWQRNNSTYQVESIIIYIYRVDVRIGIPPSENWTERKSERRRLNSIAKLQEKNKGF
jgi:DNA polymerase III epsilon subunit-like protein